MHSSTFLTSDMGTCMHTRSLRSRLAKSREVVMMSSDVWERRVRLQVALQVESRLEVWLKSIGKGAEGAGRPDPSQTQSLHQDFLEQQEGVAGQGEQCVGSGVLLDQPH